mmetsp:Transcript_2631/g.7209  ORF Transcript_2631/g.7209 Transcript_2631/m.7209 type:complete len:260 (-) Transcript_2631:19-798(-)
MPARLTTSKASSSKSDRNAKSAKRMTKMLAHRRVKTMKIWMMPMSLTKMMMMMTTMAITIKNQPRDKKLPKKTPKHQRREKVHAAPSSRPAWRIPTCPIRLWTRMRQPKREVHLARPRKRHVGKAAMTASTPIRKTAWHQRKAISIPVAKRSPRRRKRTATATATATTKAKTTVTTKAKAAPRTRARPRKRKRGQNGHADARMTAMMMIVTTTSTVTQTMNPNLPMAMTKMTGPRMSRSNAFSPLDRKRNPIGRRFAAR